jgi:carbonic anhydrase/acetyltransferase-like protein (isoleucine patch superfamily)
MMNGVIYEYKGVKPRIGREVFLAPGAVVLGDVEIGDQSNLWFYTVVRGDVHYVRIGERSNIQDHCTLHVTGGRFPLTIGSGVVVGHRAVLHGCSIGDNVLIGIGALVLDGAVVQEGAIVAAGAVVAPGAVIQANTMAAGVPARPMRETTEEDRTFISNTALGYQNYARAFAEVVRAV